MSFPNFPGIPKLASNQAVAGGALIASTGLQYVLNVMRPDWGVYKDGGKERAIDADNFISIEYTNQQTVSTYPIEKGAFASYNKVQSPFSAIVTLSKGGSVEDRDAFLNTLESLLSSTDLLWLVAEDRFYKNVTIERFDWKRASDNGASIIIASIHFIEIRDADFIVEQPAGQISSTASPPSARPSAGNGLVQPSSITNGVGVVN